jgi:glycosyltransferase involved in cell wall biosynthesis
LKTREDALRFFIFSAGFNCAGAAEHCLRSVQSQTWKNYVHVVVDDASTDGTWELVQGIKDERVVARRNAANRKWLANAMDHLTPEDEDVVALVDLDDWLTGPDVLRSVAEIYQRERCWLTYGDYCKASSLPKSKWLRRLREALALPHKSARHCRPLDQDVLDRRAFREIGYCTSHLRTFKGFLWNALRLADLLDWDQRLPVMAWDAATMYPMLEMCEPGKIRFVPEILYVYNDLNPLNDHKLDGALQQRTDSWFRAKQKHPALRRRPAE